MLLALRPSPTYAGSVLFLFDVRVPGAGSCGVGRSAEYLKIGCPPFEKRRCEAQGRATAASPLRSLHFTSLL